MNLIIILVNIFALSIIILSLINLKLSIAVYISYLILVPYLKLNIPGLTLSYNLVNAVLLLVFLYYYTIKQKKDLIFVHIKPFLFLYGALLILSVFAFSTPFAAQFFSWRASFMQTCILAFIISNIFSSDIKLLSYIKWSLIISFSIAGIYGVFLMKMGGMNPYTSFLADYFGIQDSAEGFSNVDPRVGFSSAAKIQSTMRHPMMWALNISFMIILLISFVLKERNNWYWIIILLLGLNVIVSGVRTSIAALIVGMFYFLIMNKKITQIAIASIFIIVSYFAIINNPDLSNLFASFTDVQGNKSDVNGSSIQARLEQLNGSITEVRGHELVGKGYNWHGYYLMEHGKHPVIWSFESLLFVIICDNGFLGILVYIIFFFLLLSVQRQFLKSRENILLMDLLVIFYFAYSGGTGDYGYMAFFAIYYIFLMQYLKAYELSIEKDQSKLLIPNHNKNFIKFELNQS